MAQTTGQRYRVAPVRSRGREWPFPLNLYQSAVGRKWVMAVTGLGLIAFVLALWVEAWFRRAPFSGSSG